MRMKVPPRVVLVSRRPDSLRLLMEYADFWKVPYSLERTVGENSIIVSTEPVADAEGTGAVIVSPVKDEGFRSAAKSFGIRVGPRETSFRLPYAPGISTFLRTTLYHFTGPGLDRVITDGENIVLSRVGGTNNYLLSVDLVSDYQRLLYGGLEDPPSLRFKIATSLPFSYNTIPSFIRNRSFRSTIAAGLPMEDRLGPVECLRTVFLSSLVVSSRVPIPRLAFWKRGISHMFVVTHDVETRHGLEVGAPNLAKIERAEGLRSSWNVPSDRYPLSPGDLTQLVLDGEVGGHDTRHDGRLILLEFNDKVSRLRACKASLERLSTRVIRGFRSPLLHHGRQLIQALAKANFQFDSSVPSWEPLSPTSLHSHGVGTVFPFMIDGIVEIPVSLPQDHQLVRVAGMTPEEASGQLLTLANYVAGLGGVCVLLIHPDYEFAQPEYLEDYRKLIHGLARDPKCEVVTMGQLADWWDSRSKAELVIRHDGTIELRGQIGAQLEQLTPELVTGYGPAGFTFEPLGVNNVVNNLVKGPPQAQNELR